MLNELEVKFNQHSHNGLDSPQVKGFDLHGNTKSQIIATPATIATTGNTDWYIITPYAGVIVSVDFSGVDALAANDTNYITFSLTNLGQAGAGTTAILGAVNGNTTKATGGIAISANTKFSLILSVSLNATKVQEGDRIRVRAAATGTLANTVTFPTYLIRFQ